MPSHECPRCDWWVITATNAGIHRAIAEHEAEKHRQTTREQVTAVAQWLDTHTGHGKR